MKKMIDPNTRIGVLVGGSKTEKTWSIKSGLNIVRNFKTSGACHVKLLRVDSQFIQDLVKCDVVFIATFGKPWQSGLAQSICDLHQIPYTGSDQYASALAFNKHLAKRVLKEAHIPTPVWLYTNGKAIKWNTVVSRIGRDVILKPTDEGLSKNVLRVNTQKEYHRNFKRILRESKNILVERFVEGVELTVPVIRAKNTVVLPPIKINKSSDIVHYIELSRSKKALYEKFSADKITMARIKSIAKNCFIKLNCTGVGYVDMIVDKITHIPYVLEIGTIPGYTNVSKVPFSASIQGIPIKKLLEVSVRIALNKNTDLNRIFRNVE